MKPATPPATSPAIDLTLRVDQQPSVVALLAELEPLKAERAAANAQLAEAELAKRQYWAERSAGRLDHSLDPDDFQLFELNHAIGVAIATVRNVQRREQALQQKLEEERRRVSGLMAQALLDNAAPLFEEMGALYAAVDRREKLFAELIGAANSLFPAGGRPFAPGLLSGTVAQKAKRLRALAKR
jgi:hypothetical protein